MPKFTDFLKREWNIRITLGMLPRLREAGLDIKAKMTDPAGVGGLAEDPERFGRVLYTLCEAEAKAAGVSPEQFADGFDGPTIYGATIAILEAVADFSQAPKVAEAIKAGLPAIMEKAEKTQADKLTAMAAGWNDPDGNSPASSELIPAN